MRRFDLVCFDVDGTLVVHPEQKVVWQLLNRRFLGDDDINQDRLKDYLDGRMTYEEWVALDVGGWMRVGATREQMLEALSELQLVTGARETVGSLKDQGCLLAVISGTLDLCLEALFPDHPFDDVFTNRVTFDETGRLSGFVATPFDMDGKAHALRDICRREGIPAERCAFIGDHLNDVAAAMEAGFSIAFNPKSPRLEEVASVVVRGSDLRAVLPHLTTPAGRDGV